MHVCEEYRKRYKKQFGQDRNRGIPEGVAVWQYGGSENLERLIRLGELKRHSVDGHSYISVREVIAGEETGREAGVQSVRSRKSGQGEWDKFTAVLKTLNWHFTSDAATDDAADSVPAIAYQKVGQAIIALDKQFKECNVVKEKADKSVQGLRFIHLCLMSHTPVCYTCTCV